MAARTCSAVFRIKCELSSPRVGHTAKSFIRSRHFCTSAKSTVDEEEVEKLSRTISDWWNPNGDFAALHSMNKLRVPFIKSSLEHLLGENVIPSKPLKGFRILDVGCGGGILSEPLARLGAEVTGVDASAFNIHAALRHAQHDFKVASNVQYKCITVEELADKEPESFDCVVASEVIEHVTDRDTFISASTQLLKPGGSLVITTINQTVFSYAAAIVGAEYLLRLVKPGTHDWNKFVTVDELADLISQNGAEVMDVKGMFFMPVFNKWCWIEDTSVNFALSAMKPEQIFPETTSEENPSNESET
ncbi:ubiquinone biosynthesis O-methyltransferase [Pocillopora verrucosa]|uniref:ubiquinone biosynthesis O-methyltransferase n=1 Tax=Pocillopora verrucosa TaxID=203993 RepID=UPI0033417D8F